MKKGWRGIALILAMAICGPLLFTGLSSAAGPGSEEKILLWNISGREDFLM